MKEKFYLEEAMDLDPYKGSKSTEVKELTDYLYGEVTRKARFRGRKRTRDALKLILLNLWMSNQLNRPVMYSRSPNSYSRARRYGKLYFKYNRIVKMTDTLEHMGLVAHANGFYDHKKHLGRLTRMYPTDELVKMFNHITQKFGVITLLQPKEIIQLRNKKKDEIDYKETESTINMRKNLFIYNSYIETNSINVSLPGNLLVKPKLLAELKSKLLEGVFKLNSIDIISNSNNSSKSTIPISYYDNHNHDVVYSNITTMTNKVRNIISDYRLLETKPDDMSLGEFGIDEIDFDLKYEQLKRVFNHSSFDIGGRYYGASHISLNEDVRKHISINSTTTVELDYSALHIRMLYHLEGIQYTDDPYMTLSESKEEREMYKLVQLISINSSSDEQAVMAIRNVFRKKGIKYDLANPSILFLIERFKEAHKPIAMYLNTGIGLTLQNLDSRITEAILMRLMEDDIPCLPIHDSYIVQAQHEGILNQVMVEEYEKVMGFQPVVEKK